MTCMQSLFKGNVIMYRSCEQMC